MFPNLPTDNLYKFIALFGLVIYLFSFYISLDILPEKQSEQAKINSNSIQLNYEFQDDTLNFNFLNRIAHIVTNSNDLDSISFLMNQYSLKLISINAQMLSNKEISITLKSNIKSFTRTSFWLRHLGITFMFLGFALWFYNYQIYQDLLLRKEFSTEQKVWKIELRNKATSVGLLFFFTFTSTILFLLGVISSAVHHFIFPIILGFYAFYAGKNSV